MPAPGYKGSLNSSSRIAGNTGMRDLMADWKKWGSTERLFALVLASLLIALPLRALITAAPL